MTFREMARIAGCSTSTVHGWANGALPCESIGHLKQLCEYAGMPLAIPLTGTAEKAQALPDLTSAFSEGTRFDGYARIQIFHRLPHRTLQKKEASDE